MTTPRIEINDLNPKPTSNRGRKNGAVVANRILILFTLVLLATASVFFQYQQMNLNQKLQNDEEKISLMEQTIHLQGAIIQRFNQSVTNSDVLEQLEHLEDTLEAAQAKLETQLNQTMVDVSAKLDQTLTNLDETVSEAEEEIKEQVDTVKKDFEKYVIKTEDQFSMENSFMVYQLAGTFTLLSCLISMWHMTAHLRKLKQPVIQRKILAILWMSPVYAVTSWFSLVFHSAEGYLAIIKDGYEAYIIYQFLSFCIAVLGKGDRNVVVDLLTKRADHLTPPFRLFFCCRRDPYDSDRHLADSILLQCQFFAMQFVFFRPATTIAKVVLDKYDYYGPFGADGPNDYRAPQFWVALIQNLSIFTAFTGLLKFYHAVDKDLEWCRPFAKFLCIKGVVFMTFWQGLAITVLAETTDVGGKDAEEWAMSAQNFLICLEMLLFSIAHFYCFPTDEWEEDYKVNFKKAQFGDSIALGDFVADLKLIMKGNKVSKRKMKKTPSEPTVLEGDEENPDTENDDTASNTSDLTGEADDLEDAKHIIAKAMESEVADTVELEEARRRILASGFLDDMAFMTPIERSQSDVQYGSLGSKEVEEVEEGEKETRDNEDSSATERTGLLSGEAAASTLRPSIFTTIADMNQG